MHYVNIVWWVIAAAILVSWARLAVWMAKDVVYLKTQSILRWQAILAGSVLALVLLWLFGGYWWLALPLSILLCGGLIFWYNTVRIAEMGPNGSLFRRINDSARNITEKVDQAKTQRQISLNYLNRHDQPVALPRSDDPLFAGLLVLDRFALQMIDRRVEIADFTSGREAIEARFAIDGLTSNEKAPTREEFEQLLGAVKTLAGLALDEKRKPQQGNFKVRDALGHFTTFTVRTSGSIAGEKLQLYSNEKGRWSFGLDALGLHETQLAKLKHIIHEPTGTVLVTAPPGHGQTVTLYAILRQHDAYQQSIQTVELKSHDDIEGVSINRVDLLNQDTSFHKTVNSVFLKDPNVVMLQNVGDTQTVDLVNRNAAERRIYIGMHAPDALAALQQWLKASSDKPAAIAGLRTIVAQRLVRVLCPTCRTPYQPDEATLRKLNLSGKDLHAYDANTKGIKDAKGKRMFCPDCLSVGYRGRTGLFEILEIDDEMRQAILANQSTKQIMHIAKRHNMLTLVEHGILKFAGGTTAIAEVLRVVQPAEKPAARE
jgi:type II secretory ATPase GspE/PulE/Tfp pilus assembly ATPase PilB-like protein